MTVILKAKTGGTQRSGPGMRAQRVRPDQEFEWHWPLEMPEGELAEREGDDENPPKPRVDWWRPPPRGWQIVRTVGAAEMAERVALIPKMTADEARHGANNEGGLVMGERGTGARDRELIRAAVSDLEPDNPDHYTAGNDSKPKVEAVQVRMEELLFEETGRKNYPAWLKRAHINAALQEE